MDLEQLMGRHFRLRKELSLAYRTRPWHSGHLDRLADDLAATARAIASLRTGNDQRGEPMLKLPR
jgi:hypothetical protein